KQSKGAISYLALSFADPELVTVGLKTDAGVVQPSAETITTGKYPIWAYEHMYTKGEAQGPVKALIDYALSPGFQKDVLPTVKGFMPVVAMTVSKDKD